MLDIEAIAQSFFQRKGYKASPEEINLLMEFARQLQPEMDYREQGSEDQRWSAKITRLLTAATRVAAPLNVEEITSILSEEMCTLLEVEACLVSRYLPGSNTLIPYKIPDPWPGILPKEWCVPRLLGQTIYGEFPELPRQTVHLFIEKPGLLERERTYLLEHGLQALLVLPLVNQDQSSLVGIIEIPYQVPGKSFSEEDIAIAQILSNHAVIAILHAELYQTSRQRAEELELIRQASLKLTASLEPGEVLTEILKSTFKALPGVEDAHIFLYQDNLLSFGAALWADGRASQPWMEPRPDGLTYTVARTGEMIVVDDIQEHPLFRNIAQRWQGSIVGFPLKMGSRVVGVMNVAHQRTYAFQENELRLLRLLADQAAIAIINARLHQAVQQQARTDPLTNLHNRRSFDEHLEQEVRRTDRYGHPVGLLMIDLNDFKSINDHFGHLAGDSVLRQVGNVFVRNTRDTDVVCRYGGDEFMIILPETNTQEAIQIAERLIEAARTSTIDLPDGRSLPVDYCIGVATYPEHARSQAEFIEAADQALYQAKNPEKKPRLAVYGQIPEENPS